MVIILKLFLPINMIEIAPYNIYIMLLYQKQKKSLYHNNKKPT